VREKEIEKRKTVRNNTKELKSERETDRQKTDRQRERGRDAERQ
jgi:hypothetical protein